MNKTLKVLGTIARVTGEATIIVTAMILGGAITYYGTQELVKDEYKKEILK